MKPKRDNRSRLFEIASLAVSKRGPDRVLVNDNGDAVPSQQALVVLKIIPDVVFLRKDGWTLGAPERLETLAFRMWEDEWIGFARTTKDGSKFSPIQEYAG